MLKMGLYELEKPIYIKTSGVVLRGEGMSDTGTILIGVTPKGQAGSLQERPDKCKWRVSYNSNGRN